MANIRRSQPFPGKPENPPNAEQIIKTLNTILSATTEYISMLDKQGRYVFVSENGAQLGGMKQSDIIGKTWQELGLPAELTELMEPFEVHRQHVMATGQTVTEEVLVPIASGMRWFEYVAKPVFDEQGEVEAVIISSKNITERKQVEEARYQSIVEFSSEAIYSNDLQGVITSWNSSAENLFGYAADEVLGKSVLLLVPPDRTKEQLELFERIKTGEAVMHLETVRVSKDGARIDVSVTVSPIRDGKGKIIGSSTLAHDISEQKQMLEELATRSRELERTNSELRHQSEELTQVNSALEEANRVRSQFLSTMSHELRTPLASIIGFCQLLLEEANIANFTQRQRQNLERILKNGKHLLGLINQVLDLAKIEVGRMNANASQVNVRELLTSVVEETQSIAITQNVVLRAAVEKGVGSLESDPMKLRQILINLVSNALKFTEQGEVTVSARRVGVTDTEADHIALAVKDTGIGIPPDIQEHIFEPFYQADGSNTRQFGGTGLGLSIVSQLTTLLGGNIAVTSAPGHGSTFTVILPIRVADQQLEQNDLPLYPVPLQGVPRLLPSSSRQFAPAVPQERLEVAAQKEGIGTEQKLVLAVDDNPDVLLLIQSALEYSPYDVVAVQDPSKVLEMVHTLHPCAITLDVMMPNLNGWQLLHQLKSDPATAGIPVVMLTVLSERTTGYVLGADEYLIKPFDRNALLNTLGRLVTVTFPAQDRDLAIDLAPTL